jgi:hypothetical protein
MKKSIAIIAIVLGGLSIQPAMAQFSISINIGKPQIAYNSPVNVSASFYYLPDVDCYYDLGRKQYVYNHNGSWKYAQKLPSRYSNFDLRTARKVQINEKAPYARHNDFKSKYGVNQSRNSQSVYKNNSNDSRFDNRRADNNRGGFNDQKQDWKKDNRRGK